jgi:hypothetical protein
VSVCQFVSLVWLEFWGGGRIPESLTPHLRGIT